MAGKKIAYLIIDNGVDGREQNIHQAFWDENQRNQAFSRLKSPRHYSVTEQIVNVDEAKSAVLSKLNGLEKLLLGLVPAAPLMRG